MAINVSTTNQRGFVFLEILMAVALISIVFIMLLGIGFSTITLATSLQQTTLADSLIKEELEAIRSFREGTTWATDGLQTVATGSVSPYYLSLDTSVTPPKWQLNSGTQTVGAFTRKIIFDTVSRDPSTQNIESIYNASHDDPDTRKITVIVTAGSKTWQVVSYLTNWNQ